MPTLVGLPSGHMQTSVADSALATAQIEAVQTYTEMLRMRYAHFIGHPSAFSHA